MKAVAVGLFNDSYEPIIDGVTVAVRNYAYWLNRILGPTCVVAPSAPAHRDAAPFPVLRFLSVPTFVHPPYRVGLPSLDPALKARLSRGRFSLVHAHSPFGAGRAALRAARAAGIPLVATFHSKFRDNLCQAIPFRRIVDAQVARIVEFFEAADQVWVPQESVAETLREYGYRGRYEVVENGIDYQPPPDLEPLRRRGGALLGAPEGALVGLYVGQHILEKNLEFLTRSLVAIAARVPSFFMAFVGDGCARGRLQALARRLRLDGRVRFLGEVSDREELAAIYARGDLFLFPSLFDNAPLVVREAAAFDTPAVLLRQSTAAEVIGDGRNGFLAEASPEAFAARASEILRDSAALARAGEGARLTLCRSWEDVVGEVRDRYLGILARWAS
jgi:glycosyltransferase involved in cell wall biosynthesis